jgi:hypothetical protein
MTYFGEMKEMKKQGLGKLIFDNGDFYEGEFENDLMMGVGRFTQVNPWSIYEGEFLEGKMEGLGKKIWGSKLLKPEHMSYLFFMQKSGINGS